MHPDCLPRDGRRTLAALKGPVRAHGFILAGGTALALQLGHRISEDLDFFSAAPFSTDALYREVKGRKLSPSVLQEAEGTLTVDAAGVKVSFFHHPYPFVGKLAHFGGIPLASITDIASMKVIAVSQRGARRDFIDLFFILKDTPFRKVAENMVARYGAARISPVGIGKSLVFFDDAESDPDPRYRGQGPDWESVKRFFVRNVRQIVLDLEAARSDGERPPG